MPAAFCWYLAWRYLITRWISLLGMLGVALAVWALVVVMSIFAGFIEEYRDNIRAASPDLLLSSLADDSSFEELSAALEKDPAVVATAPRLLHYAILYPRRQGTRAVRKTQILNTNPSRLNYVQILGIEPEREQQTTAMRQWLQDPAKSWSDLVRGLPWEDFNVADSAQPFQIPPERFRNDLRKLVRYGYEPPSVLQQPMPVGNQRGIVLSPTQMFRGDDWIQPGQRVDLVSARFIEQDGKQQLLKIRNPMRVAGSFATNYHLLDNFVALVHIDDLREMLGLDALQDVDLVTDVAIAIKPGAQLKPTAERLVAAVRKALPEQKDCQILTWEEQNSEFLAAIGQERALMTLVLYVVMLVAASLIYATLLMMVTQKTKDIGILMSMGATPQGVAWTFILGGLTVSIVGATIGGGLGYLTVTYLNDINDAFARWFGAGLFPKHLFQLDGIPHRLEWSWVLIVMGSAVFLSLLFSWLPARKAARLAPVLALKHE